MNAQKIAQHISKMDDECVSFNVNVSDKDIMCAGVRVLEVGMYVSTVAEDGYYSDGDLYVKWDMEGLQNNEAAQTAGMLLLRDVHSDDAVTEVMGKFYWERAFNTQLRALLKECGFSETAVNDVSSSEWGMQDEGRASYDAYIIAEEVRKAL